MHTPLALEHSAELEWKLVSSLLACWTDQSSWMALQPLLPFAPGPGKVLGGKGAGLCRALLSDALISTFCQLYQ